MEQKETDAVQNCRMCCLHSVVRCVLMFQTARSVPLVTEYVFGVWCVRTSIDRRLRYVVIDFQIQRLHPEVL